MFSKAAVDNRTGRACVMLDWFIVLSEAIPGFLGKFVGLFIPLYPRLNLMNVRIHENNDNFPDLDPVRFWCAS